MEKLIQEFLDYFPKRLKEYDDTVIRNRIFKARTIGIGSILLKKQSNGELPVQV